MCGLRYHDKMQIEINVSKIFYYPYARLPMTDILTTVRGVLQTTPVRWTNLTQAALLEVLTIAPAPGEWSALECLQHMLDTEQVFQFRLQAFMKGEDFPAFNPDTQGSKPDQNWQPADYAEKFTQLRIESVKALEKVTLEDLGRKARHQELGIVTMGEFVNEWAAHDLNHTVKAERAMMQLFLRGCGPWQVYFKDHMVSR